VAVVARLSKGYGLDYMWRPTSAPRDPGRVGMPFVYLAGCEPVRDEGQGPSREVTERPADVSGLRYLPAVQSPFPDTFITKMIAVPAAPVQLRANLWTANLMGDA